MQQRRRQQRQRRRAAARPAPRALPARAARPRRAGRTPAARDGVVGWSYGGAASEGPTGPAAPAGDAVSAEDFAAMERRRRARRAKKFKTEGFYEIRADDLVLRVPPRAALDEVVLRKLPFGGREAIYVHALDIDGLAAEQGLQAGCIMRALRDPHKSEMYPIDGDERLDFIRTNWEITDEVVAVFESSPSIGAADVAAAAQAKEAAARRAAAAPQQVAKDRPDLYGDNWEGDVYVGSAWNILTVSLAILAGISLVGIVVGFVTYGEAGSMYAPSNL